MDEPTLRLNDDALAWSSDDGEVVALDLAKIRYLGINRSGALLWTRLAVGATRTELIGLLEDEFSLPTDRAAADVDAFVRTCQDRGYVT